MRYIVTSIAILATLTFFACGGNLLTSEPEDSDDTPNEDGKTTAINECSFWSNGVTDDTTGLTWRVISFKEKTSVENDHECKTGYAPTLADFKAALDGEFFNREDCPAPVAKGIEIETTSDGTVQVNAGVDENDKSTEPDDLAEDDSSDTSITVSEKENTIVIKDGAIESDWQFCVELDEPSGDGSVDTGGGDLPNDTNTATCCGKDGYTYNGEACVQACLSPDCDDEFAAPKQCTELGSSQTPTGGYFADHLGTCQDSDPPVCDCPEGYVWETASEQCSIDLNCDDATKKMSDIRSEKFKDVDTLACETVADCTSAIVGPGAFCESPMNLDAKQIWDDLAVDPVYKSALGKFGLQCPVPEGLCAPDGELTCTNNECKIEF